MTIPLDQHVKGHNFRLTGGVNVLVNTGLDASPYCDILLEFGQKLTVANEVGMVARCMSQSKGFRNAVPWLLSLFHNYPTNGLNESHLWAIGGAIYTINDKKYYPEVISICRETKYTTARQTLMGTLARAKTEAAYDVLVECLDDPNLRGHAIEGLGRFGCVDAIPILEALEVKKGLYEVKAKATAIRRLRRKLV